LPWKARDNEHGSDSLHFASSAYVGADLEAKLTELTRHNSYDAATDSIVLDPDRTAVSAPGDDPRRIQPEQAKKKCFAMNLTGENPRQTRL
jgi:hypothetical protein